MSKDPCRLVGRYQRFTHRVTAKTIDLLRRRSSLKSVAEDTGGLSLSGVNRILNALSVPKPKTLPEAIFFDEFKGNLSGERFQCIVTDPMNHRVLDILPKRTVESIHDYLRSFPNREEVKYAVMDMNRGFRDVARTFFPNAKIIIDRFHVVRFCTQGIDNVRKSSCPAISTSASSVPGICCSSTTMIYPMTTKPSSTSCSASLTSWCKAMR